MKDFMTYLMAAIIVLSVTVGIVYLWRLASSVATPVSVIRPEPGIVCVTMSTADGVAISCIREDIE